MANMQSTGMEIRPDDPQAVAEAINPYLHDARKAKYLSYRACGFNIREACQLVGMTQAAVSNWRKRDPEFIVAEREAITSLRAELTKELVNFEFTRNYALILKKDFTVIQKSLTSNNELTDKEHSYLLKARAHYTPQQLQILQQLFAKDGDKERSFVDIVKELSERGADVIGVRKTREEVILGRTG